MADICRVGCVNINQFMMGEKTYPAKNGLTFPGIHLSQLSIANPILLIHSTYLKVAL